MAAARALLAAEAAVVRRAMGHEGVPDAEYAEAAAQLQRDFIFVPGRGAYDRANSATNSDRLASIQVRAVPMGITVYGGLFLLTQYLHGESSAVGPGNLIHLANL